MEGDIRDYWSLDVCYGRSRTSQGCHDAVSMPIFCFLIILNSNIDYILTSAKASPTLTNLGTGRAAHHLRTHTSVLPVARLSLAMSIRTAHRQRPTSILRDPSLTSFSQSSSLVRRPRQRQRDLLPPSLRRRGRCLFKTCFLR